MPTDCLCNVARYAARCYQFACSLVIFIYLAALTCFLALPAIWSFQAEEEWEDAGVTSFMNDSKLLFVSNKQTIIILTLVSKLGKGGQVNDGKGQAKGRAMFQMSCRGSELFTISNLAPNRRWRRGEGIRENFVVKLDFSRSRLFVQRWIAFQLFVGVFLLPKMESQVRGEWRWKANEARERESKRWRY